MTWFVVVKMIWLICVLFHLCRLFFLILTRPHAISVAIFFFFFLLLLCKQMHNRRIGCAVFSA